MLEETPDGRRGGRGRAEVPMVSDDEPGAALISPNNIPQSPILERETLCGNRSGAAGVRRAHAIPDFKTSARSSRAHLPSSPVQEGMLILKPFMIPYPNLGYLSADIAGGLAMIS